MSQDVSLYLIYKKKCPWVCEGHHLIIIYIHICSSPVNPLSTVDLGGVCQQFLLQQKNYTQHAHDDFSNNVQAWSSTVSKTADDSLFHVINQTDIQNCVRKWPQENICAHYWRELPTELWLGTFSAFSRLLYPKRLKLTMEHQFFLTIESFAQKPSSCN